MDEINKDDRFSHIFKDARFKVLPRKERKAYIDKRFKVCIVDLVSEMFV